MTLRDAGSAGAGGPGNWCPCGGAMTLRDASSAGAASRSPATASRRRPVPGYSMTTTTSPEPTGWPAATLTSLTVPALAAAMLFSIFIASSTHTV
jgi:hypothetical protein